LLYSAVKESLVFAAGLEDDRKPLSIWVNNLALRDVTAGSACSRVRHASTGCAMVACLLISKTVWQSGHNTQLAVKN
jgi:hypothetical protein